MLPCALNSGIQCSGAALQAGRGARVTLTFPRPAAPVPSAPESASLPCSFRFSLLLPKSPERPRPHTKGATALPLRAVRCQARRCCGHRGCWPVKQVSHRTPALTPRERAGRPQVGSIHPRARGEGRGRVTQRGSRTRQAETHRRTPRSRTGWSCWTLPSPRAQHVAARSAPVRTQPPLPSPGRSQPPRPPAHGKVLGTRSKHQPLDSACTSCSTR